MNNILINLNVKKVKVFTAVFMAVLLVVIPMMRILPDAFALSYNGNGEVSFEAKQSADKETGGIAILFQAYSELEAATINSVTMPNGITVEGASTAYVATENDSYEFQINYTVAHADEWNKGAALEERVAQICAVTIEVDQIKDDGSVIVNEENFPDAAFRKILLEGISGAPWDTNKNGILEKEEIAKNTRLAMSSRGVTNLKGIENLTSITFLSINDSKIVSADLSKNTKLVDIYAQEGILTSINLGNNPNLKNINLTKNKLVSLDLSGCTGIAEIGVGLNYELCILKLPAKIKSIKDFSQDGSLPDERVVISEDTKALYNDSRYDKGTGKWLRWTVSAEHTVSFDANGGYNAPESALVRSNESLTTASNPTATESMHTLTANVNGTISSQGGMNVLQGTDHTYALKPDNGFEIEKMDDFLVQISPFLLK